MVSVAIFLHFENRPTDANVVPSPSPNAPTPLYPFSTLSMSLTLLTVIATDSATLKIGARGAFAHRGLP